MAKKVVVDKEDLIMEGSKLLSIIRGNNTEFTIVEDTLLTKTVNTLFYEITIMRSKDGKTFKGRYFFNGKGLGPEKVTLTESGSIKDQIIRNKLKLRL